MKENEMTRLDWFRLTALCGMLASDQPPQYNPISSQMRGLILTAFKYAEIAEAECKQQEQQKATANEDQAL